MMRRVFAVLLYFFSYNWLVSAINCICAALLAAGLLIGIFGGPWAVAAVASGLFFFSMVWLGPVFRQLVSNRRLELLPAFRDAAVAALFLLAIAGSAEAVIIAAAYSDDPTIASSINAALWGFALASGLLLLHQWSCTLRFGIFLQLFYLALLLRFAQSDDFRQWFTLVEPGPLALAASFGWFWLWLALRKQANIAAPSPAQAIENWDGSANVSGIWGISWLPNVDIGGQGTPGGTLMRGANDSLVNRTAAAVFGVAGIASVFLLWSFAVGNLDSERTGTSPVAMVADILMMVSLAAFALGAPIVVSEWPIRLRFLWLRSGGDRKSLWHKLDLTILRELVLIGTVTSFIALVCVRLAGVDPILSQLCRGRNDRNGVLELPRLLDAPARRVNDRDRLFSHDSLCSVHMARNACA